MKARFADVGAVTFDFHNTLVYPRAGRGRGAMLMEYLQSRGLESDPWEHQVLYDVFASHGAEYAPRHPAAEKTRYYERFALRVFDRLNVRAAASVAADHAEAVWRMLGPDSLALFPEVLDVLRRVREAGFPSAVVSNWQCGLEHFCTELGLEAAFDHVLASAEVGSAKPDPAIFLEACRRLDVAPHRVLHVGDEVLDDIEGGRNAGLQVVLVRREDGRPMSEDVRTIRSLNRLPRLLGLA